MAMVWENIEDEHGASKPCILQNLSSKNVFTIHLDLVVNAGKNVPMEKINDVPEVWFGE